MTKVHYSLSDVHLYEIALGTNHKIYSKLMANDDCSNAVLEYINAGGYICQGQQILEATVQYDLKLEGGRTMDAGAQANAAAVARALKVAAMPVPMPNSRKVRTAGVRLRQYGIAMNPTCLTPLHDHFKRVVPRSVFDRTCEVPVDRTDSPGDLKLGAIRRRFWLPRGRFGLRILRRWPLPRACRGLFESSDLAHSITTRARGNIELGN